MNDRSLESKESIVYSFCEVWGVQPTLRPHSDVCTWTKHLTSNRCTDPRLNKISTNDKNPSIPVNRRLPIRGVYT